MLNSRMAEREKDLEASRQRRQDLEVELETLTTQSRTLQVGGAVGTTALPMWCALHALCAAGTHVACASWVFVL